MLRPVGRGVSFVVGVPAASGFGRRRPEPPYQRLEGGRLTLRTEDGATTFEVEPLRDGSWLLRTGEAGDEVRVSVREASAVTTIEARIAEAGVERLLRGEVEKPRAASGSTIPDRTVGGNTIIAARKVESSRKPSKLDAPTGARRPGNQNNERAT